MYSNKKIKTSYLIASLVILLAGVILALETSKLSHANDYDVYFAASERMQRAENAIIEYCISHGIELEEEDINGTYLIGPYYSPLMSTMGYSDIKRTTLNCNNAALMTKYYIEAGLKEGSILGIGTSGSFPGFAIAAVCAATEMHLVTKVIASYGSSMYGATRPELNIVTILQILKDSGIADFELIAVSPGSHSDSGVGSLDGFIYENTRETVLELAKSANAPLIDEGSTAKSIKKRLEYFGKLDCFVNVGGAGANSGSSSFALDFPEGLVTDMDNVPKGEERGLVFEYAQQGIPVINILNIKKITQDHGLPFDPSPLPAPGEGEIYNTPSYNLAIILGSILLGIAILVFGRIKYKKQLISWEV